MRRKRKEGRARGSKVKDKASGSTKGEERKGRGGREKRECKGKQTDKKREREGRD